MDTRLYRWALIIGYILLPLVVGGCAFLQTFAGPPAPYQRVMPDSFGGYRIYQKGDVR